MTPKRAAMPSLLERQPVERLAVFYIRVSGKKQAENFSFEYQEKDCSQYARKEGTRVLRCFKDVGSGLALKHRLGFLEMCDYALNEENGVTDIIFWELDRFTRNIGDFFIVTEKLINAGITLHLSSEEEKYDHRSEDRWHAKLVSAQGESRKISKRTKAGQRTATENGRHIGSVPWGFTIEYEEGRVDECGRLIPDPELWHHALSLWAMAKDKRLPMEIAIELGMQGVPSPSGEPWTARAVRYILENIKYAGWGFRGKEPQSRLPGPKDNTPMTLCENAHQSAIDHTDWIEIQKQIEDRRPTNSPPRSHGKESLLSRVAKCGECKTDKKTYGLTKSGQRLRCSHKKNSSTIACPASKDIRMEMLERIVICRAQNGLPHRRNVGARTPDRRKHQLCVRRRTGESQIQPQGIAEHR